MNAESVSEATDEARDGIKWLSDWMQQLEGLADRVWVHGCEGHHNFTIGLNNLLASPEGRRALLDVLQPTPEELGGEQVDASCAVWRSENGGMT